MPLAIIAVAAIGWLVVWFTAYRLRPPLLRLGAGQRVANYLLITWRMAAAIALVAAALWSFELRSGRGDLGGAFGAIGVNLRVPAAEAGALSVLLFATCYAINLAFTFLRRAAGRRPKLATVNLLPRTAGETVVFCLVLSPAAGISEEILFRGFLQWAIAAATGDPDSAVATQAILFGTVHVYQGGLGILRTAAIGLVLGAGTLICGSLIPAIIAHTLIDIASGIVRVPSSAPSS